MRVVNLLKPKNTMKKITYLLMVLCVALIAQSCEKEPESPVVPENPAEVLGGGDVANAMEFYGLWTRTSNSTYVTGPLVSNWEWRFYENGYSLRSIETYEGDKLLSLNREPIDYKFEDGKLCMKGYHESDDAWMEWDYSIEDDTLTLSTEYEGESIVWIFTRTEDADAKLVGCWDRAYTDANGRRVERHYKFHTPTYGDVYDVVYEDSGSAKVNHLFDFRYRIEGNKIVYKRLYTGYVPTEYRMNYRLVGTKLYLQEGNGQEMMYSNFYEENNLPFRP